MDIDSKEYEQAEEWYNNTAKSELIEFATENGLDIGQDKDLLDEDWNEKVIEAKYISLIKLDGK